MRCDGEKVDELAMKLVALATLEVEIGDATPAEALAATSTAAYILVKAATETGLLDDIAASLEGMVGTMEMIEEAERIIHEH